MSPCDIPLGRIKYRDAFEEPATGLVGEGEVDGGEIFDVGTWSYGHLLLTSPTVVWALLRAIHIGTITPAELDHEKVAKEFERLLTLACKSSWTG